MENLESVNDRIKYMIEREGYTIGSFARKCGVPDSTIRSYFTKDRRPNYDQIVTMIDAINRPWCDANWLVLGKQTLSEESESQDTKKLLKLISDQQRTIEEQRKRIDELTDKLLADK